jgi:hypothetical protein
MKRLSFLLVFLLFITQNVFAANIGPIATENRAGKLSLGVGYARTSSDWEAINRGPFRLELQQNQLYAEVGVGLGKKWELAFRAGAADLSVDNPFTYGSDKDGDDTFRSFGSLGVKGNFYSSPNLAIGPFVQGAYYSTYIDRAPGHSVSPGFEAIHLDEWWEMRGGLILQGVLEGAVLYGGPFYYRGEAKIRRTFDGARQEEIEIKEKGTFGALLGVRWPLGKHISVDLEGQLRSAADFGAALHYHF